MCWNADISLNTFVFACLSMVFVYVANTFTKYKVPGVDAKLYLAMAIVASVQLVEFFLWKNIKNPARNEFFSKILASIIALQPLALVLMIPNPSFRYFMLLALAACTILFMALKKDPIPFHVSVGKNGHLSWHWLNYKGPWLFLFVTFFYGVSLYAINHFRLSLFIFMIYAISMFNYFKYSKFETVGSMWCWSSNIFFLALILEILLIKPYQEYGSLC